MVRGNSGGKRNAPSYRRCKQDEPKNQLKALCVGVLQLTDMKAGEMMIAVLVIPSVYTIV